MTRDRAFIAANHHPVEATIIRIVLGLKPGTAAIGLALWNSQGILPAGVVHLRPSDGDPQDADGASDDAGDLDEGDEVLERAASDAVARLVWEGVATRLPTYRSYRDGVITSTREKEPPRQQTLCGSCRPIC